MKLDKIPILIGALMALQGCLYTNVATPSAYPRPDTRLDIKDQQVIGPAHGEACATEIIGLIYTGGAGYDDAYKDALVKSGGTSLFDVKVDTKLTTIISYLPVAISEDEALVSGNMVEDMVPGGSMLPVAGNSVIPEALYGVLCTEVSGIAVK